MNRSTWLPANLCILSVCCLVALLAAVAAPVALAAPSGQSSTAPLTNPSHLDFLLDSVPLIPVNGHTTYQIRTRRTAQAPWT